MRVCLAGTESEGLFRADGLLETVGTRLTEPVPGFGAIPGVAELVEEGPNRILEREPAGVPMSSLTDIDWVDAALVAADVAEVLATVHREGRALGGLRPELIYAQQGEALVFTGLTPRPALFFARLDHGSVGVAPAFPTVWMAPEIARGAPLAPPADVYVLGAILQRWIMDEHPFAGVTQTEQMMAIAMNRRAPYSGPTPLGDIIDDATSLGVRPSAAQVAARLRSWAQG